MLPNIGLIMLNQHILGFTHRCPTDEINKTLYSVQFFMLAQR